MNVLHSLLHQVHCRRRGDKSQTNRNRAVSRRNYHPAAVSQELTAHSLMEIKPDRNLFVLLNHIVINRGTIPILNLSKSRYTDT